MVSAKEQYKIEYGRCGVGEKRCNFREGGDICKKNERVRKQAVWVYEGRTFLDDGVASGKAPRQGCVWHVQGQHGWGKEAGEGEGRIEGSQLG